MAKADKLSNNELAELGKEFADLGPLVTLLQQREEILRGINELAAVEKEEAVKGAEGAEMAELAREERAELNIKLQETDQSIVKILTPRDKDDDRNIIIEVRAGTGKPAYLVCT
ncbi:PCRF domain-containing protein [archaeon]|nr:MAG: PCRF domain-containing protein [archaeon]